MWAQTPLDGHEVASLLEQARVQAPPGKSRPKRQVSPAPQLPGVQASPRSVLAAEEIPLAGQSAAGRQAPASEAHEEKPVRQLEVGRQTSAFTGLERRSAQMVFVGHDPELQPWVQTPPERPVPSRAQKRPLSHCCDS